MAFQLKHFLGCRYFVILNYHWKVDCVAFIDSQGSTEIEMKKLYLIMFWFHLRYKYSKSSMDPTSLATNFLFFSIHNTEYPCENRPQIVGSHPLSLKD